MSQTKKIVFLGHFGVGKTSLIRRYVDSIFSEDYLVTVGVHVKKKELDLNGEAVTLIIWDIEGNTAIEKARSSYLIGTHGFVYVFDVSRPETFENLEEEKAYLEKNYPNIPFIVVGNKTDLISSEERATNFSGSTFENCNFTSAKEGNNVAEIFTEIAARMV